jgi:gamma-glutamyltranspeptidase/glutathione hydrolase
LLAPVVIAAPDGAEVFFAGSPSGGPGSATALVDVLLRVSVDEMPLEQAIAAGRVHYAAAPETVWHEPGADQRVLAILEQAGHRLRETPELGRVNALYCPEGLPSEPESCQVASDPRGSGLAKIAE